MVQQTIPFPINFAQIFEQQVQKTPNAIAIICNDRQLTYAQLNQQANQLAHYLQESEVKSEAVVGIFMERSLDIVIAILAVLKAGATYVPIDPNYPQERVNYIAQETQFSFLLTQNQLRDFIPVSSAEVLCLDVKSNYITEHSIENLETRHSPENLAYIIYTSGSTGKPKGVQMPHINVVRYIQALSQVVSLQAVTCQYNNLYSIGSAE